MKKSLIALAVAGAMTAPMVAQADATLYGSLRIGVLDSDANNSMEVQDQSSRIGIKGSVDLYDTDTKGIFRWEQALDTDAGTLDGGRLAYIGATGNWGTATIGRQYTPYFNYTWDKVDLFNGEYSDDVREYSNRVGKSIAYATPEMAGFQAAAMITTATGAANTTTNDKEVDAYNLAAEYAAGPVTVALAFVDRDTNAANDQDVITGAVTYEAGDIYVAAVYEDAENASGNNDVENWNIAGSYTMGRTSLILGHQSTEVDAAGADDQTVTTIEVEQKVGKKARVFAQYGAANGAAEDAGTFYDALSLGYRVDF